MWTNAPLYLHPTASGRISWKRYQDCDTTVRCMRVQANYIVNPNWTSVCLTFYWHFFESTLFHLIADDRLWFCCYFTAHNYLAGALTGVTASVFLCPSELVKCRLQALREMQTRAERRGFKNVQLAPKCVPNMSFWNFISIHSTWARLSRFTFQTYGSSHANMERKWTKRILCGVLSSAK